MTIVGPNGEDHEVAEVVSSGIAKAIENAFRRPCHAEIYVFRRACAFDAKLNGKAPFECRGIAELGRDTRKKSVEDNELTAAGEIDAGG